jgi:hypothetical protein
VRSGIGSKGGASSTSRNGSSNGSSHGGSTSSNTSSRTTSSIRDGVGPAIVGSAIANGSEVGKVARKWFREVRFLARARKDMNGYQLHDFALSASMMYVDALSARSRADLEREDRSWLWRERASTFVS